MTSTSEKNFFATNLLQLQNFIKRDPTSYKDEVCLIKLIKYFNSEKLFYRIF